MYGGVYGGARCSMLSPTLRGNRHWALESSGCSFMLFWPSESTGSQSAPLCGSCISPSSFPPIRRIGAFLALWGSGTSRAHVGRSIRFAQVLGSGGCSLKTTTSSPPPPTQPSSSRNHQQKLPSSPISNPFHPLQPDTLLYPNSITTLPKHKMSAPVTPEGKLAHCPAISTTPSRTE